MLGNVDPYYSLLKILIITLSQNIWEVLQRHPLCLHRHPPDRYINTPPYVWLVAMVAVTISMSTAGWPKPGSRVRLQGAGARVRLQRCQALKASPDNGL